MFPHWFHQLSIAVLCLGALSSLVLLVDVIRRPQHMAVMNIVWPVTALFGTLAVLWAYFRYGRSASHPQHEIATAGDRTMDDMHETPYPVMVGKGALHCGSGCMLGDIAAEWLAFLVPSIAVLFGWGTLFSDRTFAVWGLDFVFAFLLGVAFQYFAIKPMRDVTPREALIDALKADTLSLISWQVGMYGAMAVLQFLIFPDVFGLRAEVNTPEFWFAMQLAMVAGFVTSYPVNWWLISAGIKEKM